jgi:hypothetical protein
MEFLTIWTEFICSGYSTGTGFSEQSNETSVSIKDGESLDKNVCL